MYLKGTVTSLSSPHISSQVDHPNRRLSTPGDTLGNPFNFCRSCPNVHCCYELFYSGYRFLMDCSSPQQGRTLESLDPGIQLPVLSSCSSILRPCSKAVSLRGALSHPLYISLISETQMSSFFALTFSSFSEWVYYLAAVPGFSLQWFLLAEHWF